MKASVYFKCEVSSVKPASILDETVGIYRMNIDIGAQSQDGKDMQVVGAVPKSEASTVSGKSIVSDLIHLISNC